MSDITEQRIWCKVHLKRKESCAFGVQKSETTLKIWDFFYFKIENKQEGLEGWKILQTNKNDEKNTTLIEYIQDLALFII